MIDLLRGMNDEERCFCELAPLYVLDLLDESDRRWVEQQAALSPDLAAELAELQETVGVIAYSASAPPLSPDLKGRLFQCLEQPDQDLPTPIAVLPESGSSRSTPELQVSHRPPAETSRRRRSTWLKVGGAIAALAIAALLIDNYQLQRRSQEATIALDVLQKPDSVVHTLQGTDKASNASGSLIANPTQKTLVILVRDLPELPAGQAYRLWAIARGVTQPTYCGQFNSQKAGKPIRWSAPESICSTKDSQLLITAESATAPPIPAGPLVMKSVI
jgi:anti-sigma-K factor RskA